jgi:hypothetical protein
MLIDLPDDKYDLAMQALELVKDIPGAAIAGGFIRDSIVGVQFKDIDIFIPYTEDKVIEAVMAKIDAEEMQSASYMSQQEVTRIWSKYLTSEDTDEYDTPEDDLLISKQHEVQIIMLAKGMTLADRIPLYDFGFCQCWFDGKTLSYTDAFVDDLTRKEYTLVHCEDKKQFDRSMRRAEKFKKRFFDWKLVIPVDIKDRFNK